MTLSGTLEDWTLVEILNMLALTKKTGTLALHGVRPGLVHVSGGQVVDAQVGAGTEPIPPNRLAVIDTLFYLAAATSGAFDVGPYRGPDGDGWVVEELLADMERLTDLETDLAEAGLLKHPAGLVGAVAEDLLIPADDWWAFSSLVSILSITQLESVFGRARAVRLLHTLWRHGLTDVLEDVELTQVDGGVSIEDADLEDWDAPEDGAAVDDTDHAEADEALVGSADESTIEPGEVVEVGASRGDETWLDDLATAEEERAAYQANTPDRRHLTGVAAPASTTLTGSVLDEMRRLRGRGGE